MSHATQIHRFGWLSAVAGVSLPSEVLDDPGQSWKAAGEALGVDQSALAEKVAQAFRLEVAELAGMDPSVASALDESVARRFWAVPLKVTAKRARIATCDPGNADTMDQLSFLLGREVDLCVASPADLLPHLDTLPMDGLEGSAEWARVEEKEDGKLDSMVMLSAESPGTLDRLVLRGIQLGASDIHVQATGRSGTVRFRVDGVLRMGPQIEPTELDMVLGRAKAVGGMDPSVRLRPQDGRAGIQVQGRDYDLRVSTIPASHSESLVIRILPQGSVLELDHYGADPDAIERVTEGFLDQTAGIFTVTGPTGSGKTTLLYALLGKLNTPERHIHTVEDPVEVEMQGLAQVQINPKAGLTFGGALRSILRQDPDVVLVGETRDAETAQIVTQAAMTGHLVATTLHTIDSATALLRFGDLEVDPGELAEALNGISAQRLLRKLCPDCRVPVTAAGSHNEEWFAEVAGGLPAFRAVGCDRCLHSGYLGRFPAVEVLLMDTELRKAILRKARVEELREMAMAGGMRTMAQVAVGRAQAGDTDVEEIRRVMGSDLISKEHLAGPKRVSPTPAGEESTATGPVPAAPVPIYSDPPSEAEASDGADALLVSSNHRHQVAVTDGLTRIGLDVEVQAEIPAAAVWAEIHRPRLLILDTVDQGAGSPQRLSEAYDAFLDLSSNLSVIVLVPPDEEAMERVLLEHHFTDYLRAPIVSEWVGFMADQVLRRVQVLGRAGGF
jgi:type II secretory ATPase GspE/PulE/Tfp pilus assembly ATPase PilB-like protein